MRGIWDIKTAERKHKTDYILAGAIIMFYDIPKSFLDLGCGFGDYCRIFEAARWKDIVGFEGTPGIIKHPRTYKSVIEIDLSYPLPETLQPFDFVLCLEVGEHIPTEYEKVFINNVVKMTKKDLVLSWAVPKQAGTGHINCRSNKYVISKLQDKGLIFDRKMTKRLRYYTKLNYFKNTLMVFKK